MAFSVLVNDIGSTPGERMKEFQNDVVEIVDKWMGKPSAPVATPEMGG